MRRDLTGRNASSICEDTRVRTTPSYTGCIYSISYNAGHVTSCHDISNEDSMRTSDTGRSSYIAVQSIHNAYSYTSLHSSYICTDTPHLTCVILTRIVAGML